MPFNWFDKKGKDAETKEKGTELGGGSKVYPITTLRDDIKELITKLEANLRAMQIEEKKEAEKNAADLKRTGAMTFSYGLKDGIKITNEGITTLKDMQDTTTASATQLKILERIEASLPSESRTRAMIGNFFRKINFHSETPHTFKLPGKKPR